MRVRNPKGHFVFGSNEKRFLIAGHAVMDQVIDDPHSPPRMSLGGPVSYSSIALAHLGLSPIVVTKIGYDFPNEYVTLLSKYGGVDLDRFKADSCKSTSFLIDRSQEPRRMWLLSRCDPLEEADFQPYLDSKTEGNGPLIVNTVAGEVSLQLLERLSRNFKVTAADSQGFLRRRMQDSSISLVQGADLSESLENVDVLKADMEEVCSWAGSNNRMESLEKVSRRVKILLLTSGGGVVSLHRKGVPEFSARPFQVRVKDTTGCGDILLAAFVAELEKGLEHAFAFSITAATLAAEKVGIEKALLDRTKIEDNLRRVEFLSG